MATYVNDLRLKEIGTGESSGTWGTETNVNLELIGEALGFGTEAITTNADTHTTTVADGSTDPGRAMYIKYTGTLDSACTITIGPNTMSRLHYIENATSGSQNIIISQGSGANITIPAGDTKAVYLDGAGSGAAVVDVFASFSAVDLKVQDDLTVTDDATIGGTLGVTGILTCTDDIIIGDGKTIGSASDVDAMTIAANGQVTFTQTLIGTALDISGDIDVDGTANLDVVDIDGATNIAAAVTMATTNKIQFRDDAIHISSTADGQLDLVADTEIQIAATTIDVNGNLDVSGTTVSAGKITADAGIDIDNINIDGTTIALSSGDLTLDVAGDLIFDADGGDWVYKDGGTEIGRFTHSASDFKIDAAGDIILDADGADIVFSDGGTNWGTVFSSSTDFVIKSLVDDKDIIFQGKDSTSSITALTLDMSDDGAAIFKSKITLDGDLDLGTGGDRSIIGPTNSSIIIKANPNASDEGIIFSTDGGTTNDFFIQDGGNIGIGDASPDAALNIERSTNYVLTNSGRAENGIHIQSGNAALGEYGGAISFTAGNIGSAAIAAVNDGGSDTDSVGLAFITHGSATSSADAIEVGRFSETGEFGILTTSPTSNLHIGASGADATRGLRIDGTNGSSQVMGCILEADGENSRVVFKVGYSGGTPAQKLMIHPDGGICFGSDTAAANALDDYEEGTWTPNWSGLGNGSASGTYVKVGQMVHVTALFTAGSTTDISTKLEATNLPFTCDQTTYSGARYENYQQNSYLGATRASSSQLRGYIINTAGATSTEVTVSSTTPFTWGAQDYAQLAITYKTS